MVGWREHKFTCLLVIKVKVNSRKAKLVGSSLWLQVGKHRCATFALVVNAEVDLMGGVVEGGVTSPWSASLQKVQEKLRQEFDVREESRRQLEFLEKGGDPLQFKYGNAASVSVQSTSLTQPDQFVISEAKGSFAFTASPHGDSVESIGRPGATLLCEPNSADNLLLFDGENECIEGERVPKQYSRTAVATLEQSTQINGNRSAQELGDSAAFDVPRKAYKRRFRRRPNRDGARSSSNDARVSAGFGSFPSHNGLSDTKGVVFDAKNKAVQNGTALLTSENGGVSCKTLLSRNQDDLESGGMKAAESTTIMLKDGEHTVPDLIYSKDKVYIQPGQHSVVSSQESPIEVARVGPESLSEKGKKGPAGQLYVDSVMVENLCGSSQKNGLISAKGGRKYLSSNNETPLTSVLESELSHTQAHINHSLDGNNDREMCTNSRFLDSNGNMKIESSLPEGIINTEMKDEGESKADDNCPFIGDICKSMCENDQYIDSGLKSMEELPSSHSDLHNKVQDRNLIKRKESVTPFSEENDSKQSVRVDDDSNHQNDSTCDVPLQASIDSSIPQLVEVAPDVAVSSAPSEGRQCDVNIKLVSKADEDSILEEARIIEAKHKRITELSAVTCPTENHRKSHWDYVLEEMAWLANDVAQERLWKITAASQISYQAAFTARSGIQEWNTSWKQKGIAQTLAKAVMGFWHSVKGSTLNQVAQCPKEGFAPAVKEYAVRFLNYNYSGPATSKQKVDSEVKGLPWENHLTEENIFYTVPPNATEMYRKSIEAHVLQYERVSSNMHKEVEMSACADLGSEDYVNEEDEGETNTYSVVFEGINPSRFAQRKHKIQMRTNKGRSYDIGADMSFSHCFENKAVNQQYMVQAKRPSSSLNVSFPTKRVRTGSRQRVLSPFIGSTSGLHLPLKAEASSGDTSSFQDDQSTLHGGPHNLNTLEDDSAGGFERQLQFDSTEAFSKPKKKKKAKFLNSSYEQRWQDNSGFQNQQRESSRKRLDGFQVEPSCSGQFGLHISKKQKIMRPSMENSFDNISPVLGSVASPVASQMSNMSNPNRIMKMLAGRDRSRKGKNPKSPAGYLTSGSQWSLFEDQALVVLVHDMGPNWELVSDAINSTLQFKCIYRKPKECRERHKILMDKTNSDAADSAEESGPSQPYPSTLPGIPKGSARQLFQRLKGPMEEDTLKSHFEKIILIGQKYLYHKTQGDNRDPKQLQQPHSSHAHALSQVFPNNMNGVPMLTPLDLCDSSPPPSSDMVSHGHQSSSTLAVSSPPGFLGGAEAASSASNSFLQGSSNIVSGNSFPSSSTSPNATVRDGRYSVSASASVSPFTEQRRNLPYNRVLPGRPNPSASPGAFPGANPGVRMLSAGSNRDGMPVVRPGFQGIIPTSPMLSSVNMIASVNIHSGVGSNNTKGNSMLRPHDALNVMQPTPQSNNNQVNPSFGGGLNTTSYSNQIPSPPTSSYPVVHPQGPNNNNVITNPQKQALLQLAKDRQLQQRLLQHQFGASNPMISPSQTTSPASSLSTTSVTPMPPSSSMTPAPHHQLKQLKHSIVPTHGLARGGAQGVAGVSSSQVVSKQRPRQTHVLQQQHSSRSHPQPRQQLPPHQQAKTVNGAGRASLLNGSASNTVQPTKLSSSITNTQVPPQSQQKIYSVKVSSQTESVQQKPSCSDDVSQGHGQPITVGPAVPCFSHQPQSHPQPRLLMSQSQPNSQRVEKHTAACSSSAGLMMSASMDCSGAADMVPDDVSAGAQAEPSNNPADDKIDSQDGPLGISRRRSSGNLSPEGKNVNVQLQQQSHTALREPLQHQHQQVLRGNSNLCDPHNNSGPD
ncbi:unnamed protein product [Cuscuta epithymum]|uniref:Myb-like domain-containing protein n=2 Tax=Cuscuta epithymum TaxID=186058 RepID=A0AAV0DJ23_9ASTE|nr:unnamed protein product [Cuscuta epithymum]